MSGGEKRRPGARGAERRVVYCLVPLELAGHLHDVLRRHFADDPDVEVVVERRRRERRQTGERRGSLVGQTDSERRRIHARDGRRAGQRRATVVPLAHRPPLPRRIRRYADAISFVERSEPSGQQAEDQDTARLVARFQAGDVEAFTPIYTRYFDRVYAYLRIVLKDPHEAEDATQQVFTKAFEALPRYERRSQPFRGWLFVIVRNYAINQLKRHSRVDVIGPEEVERRREHLVDEPAAERLDWITDRDLLIFIERLPLPQRQVLMLRYLLGLNSREMAEVLGRSPEDVRILQHRAIRFLRARLAALRRRAAGRPRARMRSWKKQAPVLRSRRWALLR